MNRVRRIRQANVLAIGVIAIVLLTHVPGGKAASGGAEKPNIVFILADDWGWGDLGCHGHRWLRTRMNSGPTTA